MKRAVTTLVVFLAVILKSGWAEAQHPQPIAITVLSWNVHGIPLLTKRRLARLERIADRIREERPDVVAIQEAWRDSADRLIHELPDYAPNAAWQNGATVSGGLLVLVRASSDWFANAAATRFHPYPDTGPAWKLWQGDGISGKGVLVVQLERRSDGVRVWFVDTHLQSQYRHDKYVGIREAQLRTLANVVTELAPRLTTTIAGDFNTFPGEAGPYAIMRGLGVDLTESAHAIPGAKTNFATDGTEGWIDYVFVRPRGEGSTVSGTTRLILNDASDDPFSDHHGLVVTAVEKP